MTSNEISVAHLGLTKQELVWLADHFRAKSQQAHQEVCLWRARALLADAQLAVLKAEYEPEGMEACS